jgi:NADH dehydrogenase FAD-containing subunit
MLIADFACDSVSKDTKRILVKPTLQLLDTHLESSHIFAVGDVAETKGPKMARAGMFQAEVVQENISVLIKGEQATKIYTPMDVEGSIKLTLGQVRILLLLASEKLLLTDFRLIG